MSSPDSKSVLLPRSYYLPQNYPLIIFKVIKEAIPKIMNEIFKKGGSLQFES